MHQELKRFEAFSNDGQRYIIFKKIDMTREAPRDENQSLPGRIRYETSDRLVVDYVSPGEYLIKGTNITLRSLSPDAQ